jgi:type III pantothenate kinase
MVLCLDIGNSQIYGGVFADDKLMFQFRRTSRQNTSSDEIGVFLRTVLRENDLNPDDITSISVCTVVPEIIHSLKNACRKYFDGVVPFILQAGVKTGLNIKYRNPLELGADRIANAVAATHLFPQKNLIIIDMGTATTICAVNTKKEFLGGAIIPGIRISMLALEQNTSKLPSVEIITADHATARSTIEGIQSGLYYGTFGAIKEIATRMRKESFNDQECVVIGTGGFSSLYENTELFDEEIHDLVLKGLYLTFKMNQTTKGARNANPNVEM